MKEKMRYKERIRIRQLLTQMLEGSNTDQENEELQVWVNAKPSNQNLFNKLNREGAYKNWLNQFNQINLSLAWEQFEKNKHKNYRYRFRQNMMRYAAIAIIALLAGGIGYLTFLKTNLKQPFVIANSDIKPGVKQAELVLSNGQIVKLGVGTEKIKESDGTHIENNAETVVYKPTETVDEEILMNKIVVKHGQEFQLVLSDGTRVWINSMSAIRFPVRFTGDTREVEVLRGEVCFKAAHDSLRPFIVHTPVHDVKVLGTTFNVSCYKEDAEVRTTLLEGKVQIDNCVGGLISELINPNEQYIFDKSGIKAKVVYVEASSVLAWTKGYFQFEDESLEQIFKKLQRWYDIDVFYVNDRQRHETFTGNLARFENIDKILEMIEEVSNVKIETDGNVIKIN